MNVTLKGPPGGRAGGLARVTARCNFEGKTLQVQDIYKQNYPHRGFPERKKSDVPSLGQGVLGGCVLDRCVPTPTPDCIEALVVARHHGLNNYEDTKPFSVV